MTDEKWRSPNNDYGPEVGLDNGDVETFKKEPEEALARETGQNSNDARYNSSYTKMEYKLFEVEHDAIPCKLRSNGMPVPLLRNGYSIFNGTKYR